MIVKGCLSLTYTGVREGSPESIKNGCREHTTFIWSFRKEKNNATENVL